MNILVNIIFYQRLFSIKLYSEQFFDITVTLGKGKWIVSEPWFPVLTLTVINLISFVN
jgi:hypothetical protein